MRCIGARARMRSKPGLEGGQGLKVGPGFGIRRLASGFSASTAGGLPEESVADRLVRQGLGEFLFIEVRETAADGAGADIYDLSDAVRAKQCPSRFPGRVRVATGEGFEGHRISRVVGGQGACGMGRLRRGYLAPANGGVSSGAGGSRASGGMTA